MIGHHFEQPITTIVGLGFLRQIKSLEEAYSFLLAWRGMQETEKECAAALKAVKAGLADEVDAETARGLVEEFARRAGVLAPNMDNVIADAAFAHLVDKPAI